MKDQDLVTLELNGKPVQAKAGSMLIEVTDAEGVQVPRFCYHKKLSVAANCRMCLVELERSSKPVPACATPISAGMKVWTRTFNAVSAQKANMEFLLINHPLDCPICDQGGECELQDVSVFYGNAVSQYSESKRVVMDKNIGPLIATEMTRCIQCTRCVRFGEEISGMRELGATGRGERMEIGTFVEKSLTSELSGNIIDICPVGALTAKPSRYKARAWEIIQHETLAPHDAVGSNLYAHTFKNKVMRIVPRENETINECWISDRDRFSYEGLYAPERLQQPAMKIDGEWQTIDWEEALEEVSSALTFAEPDETGFWVSPNATVEEMYLLRAIADHLEMPNIDSRLRQSDFSDQAADPVFPYLGCSIEALEQQESVLLIGSDIRREQPMLNHRVRKAWVDGAEVFAINPYQVDFNYTVEQLADGVDQLATHLFALAEVAGNVPKSLYDAVDIEHKPLADKAQYQTLFDSLKQADNALVLVGNMAVGHPYYAVIRALAALIQQSAGAKLGYLADGCNAVGAWLTGCVPHRDKQLQALEADHEGEHLSTMALHARQNLLLFGVEPALDCVQSHMALSSAQMSKHVVAFSHYDSDMLRDYADIILPLAHFAETSGTYINAEGKAQHFKGIAKPVGDARPGWKALRVLGNMLEVPNFDYMSSEQIFSEWQALVGKVEPDNHYKPQAFSAKPDEPLFRLGYLRRIGPSHALMSDSLVRHAKALQKQAAHQVNTVFLHHDDYARLDLPDDDRDDVQVQVFQEDEQFTMKALCSDAIPEGHALIYSGSESAGRLGNAYGYVLVQGV